jgi:hypothetical protein
MSLENTYCGNDGSAVIVVSKSKVRFAFYHKSKYLDSRLVGESLELNQNIISENHFSKLKLSFDLLLRRLRNMFVEDREKLQEYLDHKIFAMWNIIVETITDPCFTGEMLDNINFSDSPVKSARK